jgi:hypothetical protein
VTELSIGEFLLLQNNEQAKTEATVSIWTKWASAVSNYLQDSDEDDDAVKVKDRDKKKKPNNRKNTDKASNRGAPEKVSNVSADTEMAREQKSSKQVKRNDKQATHSSSDKDSEGEDDESVGEGHGESNSDSDSDSESCSDSEGNDDESKQAAAQEEEPTCFPVTRQSLQSAAGTTKTPSANAAEEGQTSQQSGRKKRRKRGQDSQRATVYEAVQSWTGSVLYGVWNQINEKVAKMMEDDSKNYEAFLRQYRDSKQHQQKKAIENVASDTVGNNNSTGPDNADSSPVVVAVVAVDPNTKEGSCDTSSDSSLVSDQTSAKQDYESLPVAADDKKSSDVTVDNSVSAHVAMVVNNVVEGAVRAVSADAKEEAKESEGGVREAVEAGSGEVGATTTAATTESGSSEGAEFIDGKGGVTIKQQIASAAMIESDGADAGLRPQWDAADSGEDSENENDGRNESALAPLGDCTASDGQGGGDGVRADSGSIHDTADEPTEEAAPAALDEEINAVHTNEAVTALSSGPGGDKVHSHEVSQAEAGSNYFEQPHFDTEEEIVL